MWRFHRKINLGRVSIFSGSFVLTKPANRSVIFFGQPGRRKWAERAVWAGRAEFPRDVLAGKLSKDEDALRGERMNPLFQCDPLGYFLKAAATFSSIEKSRLKLFLTFLATFEKYFFKLAKEVHIWMFDVDVVNLFF